MSDTGIDVSNVEIEFIIDASGSMDTKDVRGMSRWDAGQETVSGLAEDVAAHDDDGIGVTVFNSSHKRYANVTPDKVKEIFTKNRPDGGTTLAPPLRDIINQYYPLEYETTQETVRVEAPTGGFFSKLFGGGGTTATTTQRAVKTVKRSSRTKPVCIIVATDGAATDPEDVVQTIMDATKRINSRRDLGILLVQIGNDTGAEAFLKRIDSELQGRGADHDIVARCRLEDIENLSVEQLLIKAYTE